MVLASDEGHGILVDLDFATRRDDPSLEKHGYGYCTMSAPFMAMELLHDSPSIRHLYRHDLESFFWSLCWILVHYHRGKRIAHLPLKDFYQSTWTKMINAKRGALEREAEMVKAITKSFRHSWSKRLGRLTHHMYKARQAILAHDCHDPVNPIVNETADGLLTFDIFISLIS